ncbi:ATP-binding cassette domain-containing protein [Actinopolyspora mortivallis]|uniref:Daunorubicin/doxorubicin resistance ABC transporter ATP-binding protein DrrA n=1 Tax=Actinopolyspora mortivallis TaxID=33906 RepID=A0A2T0GYJ6_ACTMO|nr:ATP-binding cassette domain-containing protein [Actinopolyspora mortivallis]PRW64195.1 daunorubicin/doxorubicin resistance ABC transporter ATP-binding protein DrrA [Actinopolyspora mortivallis]
MTRPPIEVDHVSKEFGRFRALDDVSLEVPRGSVLGLLGHNGAGKTTLVNILSTLSPPTSGTARVAGYDVVRESRSVCSRIGLTGQFAAVDEHLSGLDNLVLIARLLGAGKRAATRRAEELLQLFELTEAAKRPARSYSGGMRRRLDLAASLVGRPDVIFLDEPTTGLDPSSRMGLWQIVETLVDDGTTVLLTTQYLDEADRLADSITVLSSGKVIASGTAEELKAEVGQRTASATLADPADAERALTALSTHGLNPVHDQERHVVSAPVGSSRELAVVVRALDEAGVEVDGLGLGEPTLDDVYLTLTGHSTGSAV